MDSEWLADSMAEVLQHEADLFREMERLSREQLEILSDDYPDAEEVARLMTQKQGIVGRLDQLDRDSQDTKAEWERAAQSMAEEKRDPVRVAAAEIAELLQVLMDLEREIEDKLKEHADEINRELLSILRARSALRAYGHQFAPEDARFLDRKR